MSAKKPIDTNLVEKLASICCTDEEIAIICDVSQRTLRNRARRELTRGRTAGKMSVRREQFKAAMGGNITMQIWLGKQILGQRDRHEQTTLLATQDVQIARMTDAELEAEIERLDAARRGTLAGSEGGTGPEADASVPPVRELAPGQ